jgi:hypothetical protein
VDKQTRIEWLKLTDLTVDKRIQREENPRHIARIVENFNPLYFGIVTVSRRLDGTHIILDGQQRCAAARMALGDEQKVECAVYERLTFAEEAAIFVEMNVGRKAVPALDTFQAQVFGGYDDELAINKVVEDVGFKVNPAGARYNMISAVAALRFAYSRGSNGTRERVLENALLSVKTAWDGKPESLQGDVIRGFAILFGQYLDEIDPFEFGRKLRGYQGGADGLLATARALRQARKGTVGQAVADTLLGVYNSHRRGGRLADLRKAS